MPGDAKYETDELLADLKLDEILSLKAKGQWVPGESVRELATEWGASRQYVRALANQADRHIRLDLLRGSELRSEAINTLASIRKRALDPVICRRDCKRCGGTGDSSRGECRRCDGKGYYELVETPDYRAAIKAIEVMLGVQEIDEVQSALKKRTAAPPKIVVEYAAGARGPGAGAGPAAPGEAQPAAIARAPSARAAKG